MSPLIAAIAGLGVLMAILFAAVFRPRRHVVHDGEFFELYSPRHGGSRILDKGVHTLWRPSSRIVSGEKAQRYEYPSSRGVASLRHPETGAISLRPQFCEIEFHALTQEPLKMRVRPLVQFRVDRENFHSIRELGDNFGLALTRRIEQAFEVEFGKREDQEITEQIAAVKAAVLKSLNDLESSRHIGIVFEDLNFTFHRADEPHRIRAGAPTGGGSGQATATDGHRAPHPEGVAFMEASEFDVIMNLFPNVADKKEVLLAILEMQTRRDIAEALARKGQLVVVTAQELGLAGAATQVEALRKTAAPVAPAPGGGFTRV